MKKYLEAPARAFASRALYRDVGQSWAGGVYLYLFGLLAFVWLLLSLRLLAGGLALRSDPAVLALVDQIPPITIENGVVSSPVSQPYRLHLPEEEETVWILDTTGATTGVDGDSGFLLTRDRLIIQRNRFEVREWDLSQVESFDFDGERLRGWIGPLTATLALATLVAMPLASFLYRMLVSLILAGFGAIVSKLAKIPLESGALERIAVMAMTPAIVLDTLLVLFAPSRLMNCSWWLVCGLISLAYTAFGVLANRRAAVPQSAAASPALGGFAMAARDSRAHLVVMVAAGALLALGLGSVATAWLAGAGPATVAPREAEVVPAATPAAVAVAPEEGFEIAAPEPAPSRDTPAKPRQRDYLAEVEAKLKHSMEARPLERDELERIRGATVLVRAGDSSGSGFVFQPADRLPLIATNHHVVHGRGDRLAGTIEVILGSGTATPRRIAATLLAASKPGDLAILEPASLPSSTPHLPLSPSDQVFETQPIVIAGFPFGEQLDWEEGTPSVTISTGTVSSLRYSKEGILERIQLDADLNPGNSGGPILDYAGQVVGVAVETIATTNISFVIPASRLRMLLDGFVSKTTVYPSEWRRTGKIRVVLTTQDPLGRITEVGFNALPPGAEPTAEQLQRGHGQLIGRRVAARPAAATTEVEARIAGREGDLVWIQAWYENREGAHGLMPLPLTLGSSALPGMGQRRAGRGDGSGRQPGRGSPSPPPPTGPKWAESPPVPDWTPPRLQNELQLGAELVEAGRIPLQAVISDLEVAADGDHLFVLVQSDSEVLKVDLRSFQAVGRATIEDGAVAMALTPDGRRLFVASQAGTGGRITELGPDLGKRGSFLIGALPVEIAATDSGLVLVSRKAQWDGVVVVKADEKHVGGEPQGPVGRPVPGQRRPEAGGGRRHVDLRQRGAGAPSRSAARLRREPRPVAGGLPSGGPDELQGRRRVRLAVLEPRQPLPRRLPPGRRPGAVARRPVPVRRPRGGAAPRAVEGRRPALRPALSPVELDRVLGGLRDLLRRPDVGYRLRLLGQRHDRPGQDLPGGQAPLRSGPRRRGEAADRRRFRGTVG